VLFAERAGVVDAAREQGIIAFGNVNDMNQEEDGKGVVVTSALWDMNAAIGNAIALTKEGNFAADNYKDWTMMAKGGSSLAPYYEFEDKIPADAKAKVEEVKAQILDGSYTVEIIDDEPKSTF
jgi:basic membrane lipoprotein Med (substrate-binding protein (PBP1-ABC) superfamily)